MRSLLIFGLVACTGCATSYSYHLDVDDAQGRQRVTERAASAPVIVRVQGEAGVSARALSVRADSTTWIDAATGSERTVGTDQLRSITFPGRDGGVFKTAALGIGTGLVTGALTGFAAYEFPNGPIDSRSKAALAGAVGAGIVGGVVGGTVGMDRQHSDVFIVRRQAVVQD